MITINKKPVWKVNNKFKFKVINFYDNVTGEILIDCIITELTVIKLYQENLILKEEKLIRKLSDIDNSFFIGCNDAVLGYMSTSSDYVLYLNKALYNITLTETIKTYKLNYIKVYECDIDFDVINKKQEIKNEKILFIYKSNHFKTSYANKLEELQKTGVDCSIYSLDSILTKYKNDPEFYKLFNILIRDIKINNILNDDSDI